MRRMSRPNWHLETVTYCTRYEWYQEDGYAHRNILRCSSSRYSAACLRVLWLSLGRSCYERQHEICSELYIYTAVSTYCTPVVCVQEIHFTRTPRGHVGHCWFFDYFCNYNGHGNLPVPGITLFIYLALVLRIRTTLLVYIHRQSST